VIRFLFFLFCIVILTVSSYAYGFAVAPHKIDLHTKEIILINPNIDSISVNIEGCEDILFIERNITLLSGKHTIKLRNNPFNTTSCSLDFYVTSSAYMSAISIPVLGVESEVKNPTKKIPWLIIGVIIIFS